MEHINKEQKMQLESVHAALLGWPERTFNPVQARAALFPFSAPRAAFHSHARHFLVLVSLDFHQASESYIDFMCFTHHLQPN